MPQASDEDRKKYTDRFPDIGCKHAIHELEKCGYKLSRQWEWTVPEGHTPTDEELFWIGFLIDEWDFGGISHG